MRDKSSLIVRLSNDVLVNDLNGALVLSDTTENWNAKPELVSRKNYIYVYTDYKIVDDVVVPGIKIGDGKAYLIDMPFISAGDAQEILDKLDRHIADIEAHVSSDDRNRWDNKVTCYLSEVSNEHLIFSKD